MRPVTALVCAVCLVQPANTMVATSMTWWHPGPLQSWAYVIGENYPLAVPPIVAGRKTKVQAVDADLGDQDGLTPSGAPVPEPVIEASVRAVHAMGAHAICYIDAGTAENWRSDYTKFDPGELGGPLPGWQGERFIDIADWSTPVRAPHETLETIMANRVALCKEEGFDAIEADNVDAYTYRNLGGFRLSMQEEAAYVERLVTLAHAHGLAFFLKNEINGDGLLGMLAPHVDGEIDEQCWQYNECRALRVFVQERKPILEVEYQDISSKVLCPKARAFPMATIRAGLNLSGPITYAC